MQVKIGTLLNNGMIVVETNNNGVILFADDRGQLFRLLKVVSLNRRRLPIY